VELARSADVALSPTIRMFETGLHSSLHRKDR
jgi:hypothetical protein